MHPDSNLIWVVCEFTLLNTSQFSANLLLCFCSVSGHRDFNSIHNTLIFFFNFWGVCLDFRLGEKKEEEDGKQGAAESVW